MTPSPSPTDGQPPIVGCPTRLIDGEPHQFCQGCRHWWPLTGEFFRHQAGRKTGFDSRCKACYVDYQAQAYRKRRRPIPEHLRELVSVPWLGSHPLTLPTQYRSPK